MSLRRKTIRRRRHRVASLGRCVAPPSRMACLQRLAGTEPVWLLKAIAN